MLNEILGMHELSAQLSLTSLGCGDAHVCPTTICALTSNMSCTQSALKKLHGQKKGVFNGDAKIRVEEHNPILLEESDDTYG